MVTLLKKMLRDLWENKGAYIACTVIIVIGLMTYTSFKIVSINLTEAKEVFYDEQNFADGFATVQAIPVSEVEKLKNIAGIKDLQGRLVKDVRVILPDKTENVYVRLVSVDPGLTQPINDVKPESGSALRAHELNIWLDSKFFAANQFELNEMLEIIADGKKRQLRIAGVGMNPEFVYAMRNPSDLFPQPGEFGIAYLPYEMMKSLFPEKGTFNSLIFTLQEGADYQEVENLLKPELSPYGLTGIYPRKDQMSEVLLSGELEQLKNMSNTMPIIFLGVASLILYIMLKRMIENQRGQIGVLKAQGFSNREILFHYMSFALVIGLVGGVLGGLAGMALSGPFMAIYRQYFNLPGLEGSYNPIYMLWSVLMALVFTSLAGYRGCRFVLTLQPAEAMRPAAPLAGREVFLEKITFLWNTLTVQGRMSVRNMLRNRSRSFFIFLGMMFTFTLLGLTWSMWEMSEEMMFDQFEKVEIYDVKVSLAYPQNQKAVEQELNRFPGMLRVESKAEIPITLRNEWKKKDVVILGIPKNSQLHKILDREGQEQDPPEQGILISQRLSKLLGAGTGDWVTLESLMFRDPQEAKALQVAGVIPQFLGLNAYMELAALQELLEQGPFVTTVMLKIDEKSIPSLHEEYKNAQAIDGIEDRNKMLQQLRQLMASSSGTIYIMMLIGMIVGFAIVYNSSLVSVSERSRELASMMVMGMTWQEVMAVVTFEQWVIAFFGMLAGIPMTKLALIGLAQSLSNDVYSMPSSMGRIAILAAFFVTGLSVWIAQRAVARKIRRLVIVDVLKTGE